jgi:LEA14-like dessication related protein
VLISLYNRDIIERNTRIERKEHRMRIKDVRQLLCIVSLLLCTSCATLSNVAKFRKPEVAVQEIRIERLSFTSADLLCNLTVKNPNPVGLRLSRFEYDLLIEGSSFIAGVQESGLQIQAEGSSPVELPLNIVYKNLYEGFRALTGRDAAEYRLKLSFSFQVPVLGDVTVPVTTEGELPLLRIPSVRVKSLKLARIGLTTADLTLIVLLENPNPLSLDLSSLEYLLTMNDAEWISGRSLTPMHVSEKDEGQISIPISLNFVQIGRSVYNLLTQDSELEYAFQGNVRFTTSMPVMGEVLFPFESRGKIGIVRDE